MGATILHLIVDEREPAWQSLLLFPPGINDDLVTLHTHGEHLLHS